MSSLFEAGGLGVLPFSLSFSSVHESMSRAFAEMGRKAHQFLSASVMTMAEGLVVGCAAMVTTLLGKGAPIFTHSMRSSICFWDNFFFGGIDKSGSRYLTALTSSDSSGLPGTMTTPSSPPRMAADLESRRSSPFCFFSPWQDQQFSA